MACCIDYRLPHSRFGKFKPRRRRRTVCCVVQTDLIADVRHDKERRVINHREDITYVYLMFNHLFLS